jgi:Fe-S-cluster-containing hydrogenase component 2
MIIVNIDLGKCDGDGTCANLCPGGAINGGKAEAVNMAECINCQTCVENCPQSAITSPRCNRHHGINAMNKRARSFDRALSFFSSSV